VNVAESICLPMISGISLGFSLRLTGVHCFFSQVRIVRKPMLTVAAGGRMMGKPGVKHGF